MVGKTTRKKQAIQAIERDNSHVSIDTDKLFAGTDRAVLEALPEWMQWISDLSGAASATEQLRLVQQGKKKIRPLLQQSDASSGVLQAVLAVVLRLYLQPQYFSFHIALDWTTSLLKELLATASSQVRSVVLSVSLEAVSQAKVEVRANGDLLAALLPWQSAFSSIVLLDRDLDVLADEDLRDLVGLLALHVTALQALDVAALTAADLVKHTTCCADSLRNISSLLKTHLDVVLRCGWSNECCTGLKQRAAAFLCSPHSPKDCLSAAAAVYLLAHRVLAANDESIVAIMSDVVDQRFPEDICRLSSISQCALVKEGAVLFTALLWAQPALPHQCLQLILKVSEDASSSAVQLFALQSLEAWLAALRRANALIELTAARHCLRVLCGSWSHPARQVNHIVPDIFSRLVAVLTEQGQCEEAVAEALRMPGQHRGRYQALRLLLDKLGPAAITALRPNLVATLIQALHEREVAASVATLLQALLSAADRPLLLQALTSRDVCLRGHTADYLLPHIISLPWCAPPVLIADLVAMLQENGASPAASPSPQPAQGEDSQSRLAVLAGLVAVLLAVKTAGLATGPLPVALLQQACCVADATVRGNAIVASVQSLKMSQALSTEEFSILRMALRFSLKTVEADECMKIQRAVRALLLRCSPRSGASTAAAGRNSLPPPEREMELGEVVSWLVSEAVDGVYPGATFDREYACLSVLEVVATTTADAKHLVHPDVTPALLASFLSNWDRSRALASSLLSRMPAPWPGYLTAEAVRPLLTYALGMAQSARLRESDAGAQLLCNIYCSYCVGLGWTVDVDSEKIDVVAREQAAGEAIDGHSATSFLQSLISRTHHTLSTLATLFDALSGTSSSSSTLEAASQVLSSLDVSFPLAHGLVHALRLCLTAHRPAQAAAALWRPIIAACHACALRALDVAMKVVAEAASDVPFAPSGNSSCGSSKGPVNMSMAATYVNTNTYACSTEDASKAQRGVVAAWLLVKESSALLAAMVHACPVPSAEPAQGEIALLTTVEVQQVGEVLLSALGRLKHMGAIAEAHLALQSVTSLLCKLDDANATLAALPSMWLDALLRRLLAREQVFILRRSAGYAYSFLSILRSEPANSPPVLLQRATTTLLHVIAEGLATEDEQVWKLSVHALNVLRTLFLDASFSADLADFLSETLQLTIRGFLSVHWAIRNSSMMLFSACVTRCITKEKNDRTTANAMLASDFFARHPTLLPFLTEMLRNRADCPEESQEGVVYPILLLLAKFRPPLEEPQATGASVTDLAATAETVQHCLGHRLHMIRSVAARATTSLAAVVSLPKLLEATLSSLHGRPTQPTNETHGRLLLCLDALDQLAAQQRAGLDPSGGVFADTLTALRSPSLLSAVEAAVQRLLPRSQPVCPPVAHVLMQVLTRLLSFSVDVEGLLTFAVYKSLADLLGLREHDPNARVELTLAEDRMRLPWAPALALQTVQCFYSLARSDSADSMLLHLLPFTTAFVRCSLTEVRDGAYAGLRDLIERLSPGACGPTVLQHYLLLLAEQVDREREPASLESLSALLQLVATRFRATNAEVAVTVVVAAAASAACETVLLRDLDRPRACTPALLEVFSLSAATGDLATRRAWFDAIRRAAHEDQPADLRLAAADALRDSGLLARRQKETTVPAFPDTNDDGDDDDDDSEADLAQDQLLLAFDLLQDDDEDVRESANQLLCTLAAFSPSAIVTTVVSNVSLLLSA